MSVTDMDDGLKYYAQLRGFLEDQYYQKSAVISWLIPSPSNRNSQHGFHPSLYVAGYTFSSAFHSYLNLAMFCCYR